MNNMNINKTWTKAKLFGANCLINLDTNEVKGTNWINDLYISTCLVIIGTTKPNELYYSLEIKSEDSKSDYVDILKDQSNHNLVDILIRIKAGRPAEDQKFLDKCIKTLTSKK